MCPHAEAVSIRAHCALSTTSLPCQTNVCRHSADTPADRTADDTAATAAATWCIPQYTIHCAALCDSALSPRLLPAQLHHHCPVFRFWLPCLLSLSSTLAKPSCMQTADYGYQAHAVQRYAGTPDGNTVLLGLQNKPPRACTTKVVTQAGCLGVPSQPRERRRPCSNGSADH